MKLECVSVIALSVFSQLCSMDNTDLFIMASSNRANKQAQQTQALIAYQNKILEENGERDLLSLRIAEEQLLRKRLKGEYLKANEPKDPEAIWINDMVDTIFQEREAKRLLAEKRAREERKRLEAEALRRQQEEECCLIF